MARAMTAKFPGTCRGCGEAIEPGDRIVHAGRKRNYHDRCHEDDTDDGGRRRRRRPRRSCEEGEAATDELAAARRERAHEDAEYAAGKADYERWRSNRDLFGEEYAAAEEMAWEGRLGLY